MYKERARPFAMDGGQSTRVLFQPWMVDGESVLWCSDHYWWSEHQSTFPTISGQGEEILILDLQLRFPVFKAHLFKLSLTLNNGMGSINLMNRNFTVVFHYWIE